MSVRSELRRPSFLGLLLLGLLAGFAGAVTGPAAAVQLPTPTRIHIDSITSDVAPPAGTPTGANPYVLVEAGQPFTVHVSFTDSTNAPAAFNKDTTLTVSSNRGALDPGTGLALKDATTADITTSLASPANLVELTVGASGGKLARTVAPGVSGPSQLFDVLSELQFFPSGPAFQQGIGGDGGCANATRLDPVCGILVLPHGSAGPSVLLSLGACGGTGSTDTYTRCASAKGSVVQALADLDSDTGPLYSSTDPATIIVKCDKLLCGGGSIQSQTLNFTTGGNTALEDVGPCPAKGTMVDRWTPCVDYVQSKRDNAGDSWLYLLFADDARVSVG